MKKTICASNRRQAYLAKQIVYYYPFKEKHTGTLVSWTDDKVIVLPVGEKYPVTVAKWRCEL